MDGRTKTIFVFQTFRLLWTPTAGGARTEVEPSPARITPRSVPVHSSTQFFSVTKNSVKKGLILIRYLSKKESRNKPYNQCSGSCVSSDDDLMDPNPYYFIKDSKKHQNVHKNVKVVSGRVSDPDPHSNC
jgi:hypothetical protein